MTMLSYPGPRGRPQVLFVTYTFPPARTAGSVRTWNMAKYLARAGWGVTVLTPDPSLWRCVEHGDVKEATLQDAGIRRVVTGLRWQWLAGRHIKYPGGVLGWFLGGIGRRMLARVGFDGTVGWIGAADRASSNLTRSDVDVVLASGPTFSAFPLARRLADRFGRPYVLDYRDLWSQNLHQPAEAAARREASLLAGSAAVTTVSPSWAQVLDQRFNVGPKLHVISNGYDAEELASVEPCRFGHFAIVYTGALWPPKRVISPVMEALKRLDERVEGSHRPWMFHYYGRHNEHVKQEAEHFRISRRVVLHGEVSRREALQAVRGAAAAVVVTSTTEPATAEDNGMVTGKLFEAIGLGTPTVLIAPLGSDANAVAETTGLARRFSASDVDQIALFLAELIQGRSLERREPEAYAWKTLVRGFDKVLRMVIQG